MAKTFEKLKTDVEKNEKSEGGEVEESFAGSPQTAATNCAKVKEFADYKRNGYYWIKNKCMP